MSYLKLAGPTYNGILLNVADVTAVKFSQKESDTARSLAISKKGNTYKIFYTI